MILFPGSLTVPGASAHIFQSPSFTSEEAAVKAAADIYNPISIKEDREFIGAIILMAGKYYFTVTAGELHDDTVSLRVPGQLWAHVVAFRHTHGGEDYYRGYFSDVDTAMVNRYGKPFYLADHTGFLKVYQPGGRKLKKFMSIKLGLPGQNGFATGKKVRDSCNQIIRVKTAGDSSVMNNVAAK